MSINYIWFDLGYTLVYQDREQVYARYLKEQGIDVARERIEEAYHLADKYFMREYPGVLAKERDTFFAWYLGVLNHSLGQHFPLTEQCNRILEIQQELVGGWQPFPFTHAVLKSLRERSYRVGLISNWDHTARDVLERNGILPLLDQIVISSEVGIEKPDQAIFQLALERAGTTPEECLYVGDNYYDDVIGSERAGMQSCLINRFGSLGIEELESVHVILSIQELPQLLSASSKIIS
ncbi:HAD family hydrolase [Paenibacillus sp. JCM 10914]|uniref:HAD family hydrolase n=1 Tax=Paenibacillus sp. JCM 10914 TaxID=1236974 RepID=UPI0003CC3392|nr:HAD-IA family hydrolase [Paenibacillus sp. JCM 10914]GAE07704.1 hydrolase related to 2-haloalkanoic acid dehalogenase [Paenibacillus sp. JCM 10914]